MVCQLDNLYDAFYTQGAAYRNIHGDAPTKYTNRFGGRKDRAYYLAKAILAKYSEYR